LNRLRQRIPQALIPCEGEAPGFVAMQQHLVTEIHDPVKIVTLVVSHFAKL